MRYLQCHFWVEKWTSWAFKQHPQHSSQNWFEGKSSNGKRLEFKSENRSQMWILWHEIFVKKETCGAFSQSQKSAAAATRNSNYATGSVMANCFCFVFNQLREIEIWKLDFLGRWFWNSEIWEILLVQPVFMKSILCAIYSPICKLAKKIGKKLL